ncbi:HU family DNA-binding protein [Primorskyibacter sp. 2E107]|uniref:HU family DNA-binding protein n=1 Tax=Primorskyibacter sp. 2E107 TaxID=3403458 RepID=UPI003AF65CDA
MSTETKPVKPAARRKRRAAPPVAAPEQAAHAVSLTLDGEAHVALPPNDLRKAELIDLVVERSGVRKRDAKPAVEAALAILGQALAEGRPLALQPLGKVRHLTVKERPNARVINLRLRQPKQGEISSQDPLDPSGEEG